MYRFELIAAAALFVCGSAGAQPPPDMLIARVGMLETRADSTDARLSAIEARLGMASPVPAPTLIQPATFRKGAAATTAVVAGPVTTQTVVSQPLAYSTISYGAPMYSGMFAADDGSGACANGSCVAQATPAGRLGLFARMRARRGY